ncbi:MAG: hypothetical protein QOG03_1041 [Actinomycetota bacterium]|jgi:hypothetical protein|nr:hypothetical protein [Actinomycetota bacterium]
MRTKLGIGIAVMIMVMAAAMVNPIGARAGTPRERAAAGTVVLRTGEIITVAATGEKGAYGTITWQTSADAPVVTIALSCAVIVWQSPPLDPSQVPDGEYWTLIGVKASGLGSDGRVHYIWAGDSVRTYSTGDVVRKQGAVVSDTPEGPDDQCGATLSTSATPVAEGQLAYVL